MKTKLHLSSLQVLLYLISLTSLAQQPKLEWAQRWNSEANVYESAVAVAVDAAGNSYVTGYSFGNTSPSGITTVKYSPTGEQLWVKFDRDLTPDPSIGIAVDNQGGVYVSGTVVDSSYTCPGGVGTCIIPDFLTVRYDAATGDRTWASRFGTVGDNDNPRAIAVDNKGGVYVTGTSSVFDVPANFATVRYDAATGKQTWVSRYDSPGNFQDVAMDLAIDNQGGVYVTGHSYSSDTTAYIVAVRYDASTGEESWVSRYDEPGTNEYASAIAVDNQGSVFITGRQSNTNIPGVNYATVRLDAPSGERVWASNFTGAEGSFNSPIDIAVDKQGGVYVTGNSGSSDFPNQDYATVRYDVATGEEAWATFYNSSENSYDRATALAVDTLGGVFVTGSNSNSDLTNQDYATVRYDAATGEESWLKTYDGPRELPDESPDLANDIAIDNRGGVIVTGESYADFGTVRYDATTGEQTWAQIYNVRENANDFSIAVAVDAAGNSYVTGTRKVGFGWVVTIKYSPSGEELWEAQFDLDRTSGIALDNQGGVYVTGVYFNNENFTLDYATIRYDAVTGEQTWISFYNGPAMNYDDHARAIAVDSAGGVYVTGFSYNEDLTTDYATVRYDAATGEQTWASRYSGPEGVSIDSAAAITIDDQGGVYVTGVSAIDSTNTAFATVRYEASTGEESWASRYGEDSGADVATAIATDQQGGVYVTGYSGSADAGFDYTSVRYDAATGEESWASSYSGGNSSDDRARAIAVDTAGGVYVTGTSTSGNTSDYATLRYDATTGEESWISRYDGSASSRDSAAAIGVDNAGGVYVTGVSNVNQNADFATVRYDATTGEQVWAERYDSPYNQEDVAVDMALDRGNNLIITGYSYSPETFYDFLTVKYSQCLSLAQVNITGSTNAAVSTNNSTYSISTPGATSYTWSITDIDGNAYTDFRGQGSGAIAVDWPEEPNVYKISVASSAAGGCEAQTSVLYVHVYDPEAGFVSGGGWSDSPANAEYELMRQGGMLYWGFVARFRDEEKVQGSALVILDAGPTIFRSTSVEDGSLVISANRAFFRGTGVLLNQRGLDTDTDDRRFGYLIAATDGHLGPNTGPDQLRLKIWVMKEDGTEGEVVYDNQVGCTSASLDHNAPACSAIDRGDIIINKPQSGSLSSAISQNAVEPAIEGLEVYPTAFSDRTTLSFATESETAYTLELYDLKGALVQSIATGQAEVGKRYEHELSAESLPRGMYLVRLSTGDKVQAVKVVVER
jgi:uncharacterized delta-60 repeat protein